MRIDVSKPVLDYEGQPVMQGENVLTVREAISVALNSQGPNEVLTAETKGRIFQIGSKLYKDKELRLTIEEAALVKERAGLILTPLAYGRVVEVLEGKSDENEGDGAS